MKNSVFLIIFLAVCVGIACLLPVRVVLAIVIILQVMNLAAHEANKSNTNGEK